MLARGGEGGGSVLIGETRVIQLADTDGLLDLATRRWIIRVVDGLTSSNRGGEVFLIVKYLLDYSVGYIGRRRLNTRGE